jgi:hypothetical protein
MAAKTAKIRIAPNTIITLEDGTLAREGEVVTLPAQHAAAFEAAGQAVDASR